MALLLRAVVKGDSMALNASSRMRPKVVTLQKSSIAEILQRTETAAENGALADTKAPERSRTKMRIRFLAAAPRGF
ncbi:hypothetical protein DWV00_07315 [Trinickia dinghuensis]|uniref:Uncharacterized protein n=1 Tax=Trinickia dinghuensis TaxID=2291023 RepID=A0A3D8K3L3_9BURK|nr:hypothetical protein DWV00_07315 [Trinickia dinghuensis]